MMKGDSHAAGILIAVLLIACSAALFTPIAHAQSCTSPTCTDAQSCVYSDSTKTSSICVSNDPQCNPACPSGQYCLYSGSTGSQTKCIANDFGSASNPIVVQATSPTSPATSGGTFASLVNNGVTLLNGSLVPLLYALAFLYFMVGVARFIFLGGQEGREKGKNMMIYGLIGLVVIFGIWGIVNLLLTTLQFK